MSLGRKLEKNPGKHVSFASEARVPYVTVVPGLFVRFARVDLRFKRVHLEGQLQSLPHPEKV